MAAKQQRTEQRERHAARVESIRDSGRAAADDLRSLSRPGTAAEVSVAAGATTPALSLGISSAMELAGVRTSPSSSVSSSQANGGLTAATGGAVAGAIAVVVGDAGVDKNASCDGVGHAGARERGRSPSVSPGRTRVAMVSKESAVSMMTGLTMAGRAGAAASSAPGVRYGNTAFAVLK